MPAYGVKEMQINKQMENNRIALWSGVNVIIPSIIAACHSGFSRINDAHFARKNGPFSVWESSWAKSTAKVLSIDHEIISSSFCHDSSLPSLEVLFFVLVIIILSCGLN